MRAAWLVAVLWAGPVLLVGIDLAFASDDRCGGAPLSCDDGDVCTDDACSPAGGCANTPRAGFAGVRCPLERLRALDPCGGTPTPERLRRLLAQRIGEVVALVDRAEVAAKPTRRATLLRRAQAQLAALARKVANLGARGAVTAECDAEIRAILPGGAIRGIL